MKDMPIIAVLANIFWLLSLWTDILVLLLSDFNSSPSVICSLRSGPTWADQAPSGCENLEQAEDPQLGRGGKNPPGDPEPQAFQAPSHN